MEVKPGMPLGAFKEELVIETDHPLRPLVKVTIAGKATGPISVVPERLQIKGMTERRGRDSGPDSVGPGRQGHQVRCRERARGASMLISHQMILRRSKDDID